MKSNVTEIIFLLDRSGSMEGLEDDTIGGFNSFIKHQRKLAGEVLVTTVLFDNQYEILWNGAKAEEVNLTKENYFVRGSTALLDAVGRTILEVAHRVTRTEAKVVFVITTDGLENASREFTYKKVKQLIEQHQEKYKWEFIFLGANIDVPSEAESLGIKPELAFSFEASSDGVENMYQLVSEAVTAKRI